MPKDVYPIAINFDGSVHQMIHVDFGALSEHIQQSVIDYGLKQLLNDAGSGAKTPEDKVKAAETRLETIKSGTWTKKRKSAAGFGPFALWVFEQKLLKPLRNAMKAKGKEHTKPAIQKWLKEKGGLEVEDWVKAIPSLEGKIPEYEKAFKKYLESQAEGTDVDVSDVEI